MKDKVLDIVSNYVEENFTEEVRLHDIHFYENKPLVSVQWIPTEATISGIVKNVIHNFEEHEKDIIQSKIGNFNFVVEKNPAFCRDFVRIEMDSERPFSLELMEKLQFNFYTFVNKMYRDIKHEVELFAIHTHTELF